ncbi:hypothetical protein [Bathymodiolus japonicus methanotrophic gill symbiont]|uniref:hypothetical protein n=1 Tax=Bathymodiolus japonicus methanotrophic gill symbiont TaxID=113269 RepID=UPI001C8DF3DF|nr:hypothetical protein [Bathymodiolus japonicus methanotrophic gill symbiont]
MRKLVLGIPAQASGKNLTGPLMPSAPQPPCVRHRLSTKQLSHGYHKWLYGYSG